MFSSAIKAEITGEWKQNPEIFVVLMLCIETKGRIFKEYQMPFI